MMTSRRRKALALDVERSERLSGFKLEAKMKMGWHRGNQSIIVTLQLNQNWATLVGIHAVEGVFCEKSRHENIPQTRPGLQEEPEYSPQTETFLFMV